MMDISVLRYVVTLARCNTYAEAAEELRISQPSLTRAVQQLERHYGVRLFDRGRHGASVTAEGRNLIEGAAGLIAHAENLEQQWASIASGVAGIVRFGIAPMPARALLADVLAERMRAYPEVRNEVAVGNVDRLVQLLTSGRIEFFIAAEGQIESAPHLSSRPLGEFPVDLIVRAGHPLTRPDAKPGPYPLLMSSRTGLALAAEMARMDVGRPHVIDDFNVLVELTLESDAILQTSAYTVAKELRSGTLTRLDWQSGVSSRIMFYSMERRSLSRMAATLKAMFQSRIVALRDQAS